MLVPFSVSDFIDRAVQVYGDRVGVVDEPDQPAPSLGDLTYAQLGDLARRQAAQLDELGVGVGDRVAVVSHNSARLLTSFFGVSGYGRVLVPVNFRLRPDEVRYIVEHSGARVLYVDPELDDALKDVTAEHRFVLGEDEDLYAPEGAEPKPWEPDENATATINYTSGTTARPKGVQITHRNIWTNAVTFALHAGVTDRDVYLHTLPMFHANGWGMPFAMTGMGVPNVVLRKVDGAEILRRVESTASRSCAPPRPWWPRCWRPRRTGRARSPAATGCASSWPAPRRPRRPWCGSRRSSAGSSSRSTASPRPRPLLTVNRTRAEWDDLAAEERAEKLARAGHARARGHPQGRRSPRTRRTITDRRGAGPLQRRARGLLGAARGDRAGAPGRLVPHRRRRHDRRRRLPHDLGPQEGRDHHRRRERLAPSRSRTCSSPTRPSPRSRSSAYPTRSGARPSRRSSCSRGQEVTEAELIAWCKERAAGYKAPTSVEFREELARTATGKLQKFKLRAPYWEGRDRQVN